MPLVTMPDGQLVDLPDDLTPEQATRLRGAAAASPPAQEKGLLERGWEATKGLAADVARGAGRGLASLAEGAAAFNSTERPSFNRRPDGKTVVGPSPDTGQALTEAVNTALPTPTGDGVGRQYLRAGLEGVGGALSFPAAGGLGINAFAGGMGGVGSEASARVFGEGPVQRFLGGLAGGVGGSLAANKASNAVRPQVASVAKEAIEGISEAQLQSAQQLQAAMAAKGVKLDLAQALEGVGVPKNNLTTVRDAIANSQYGNKTQALLRSQPADVAQELRQATATMPGRNYGVQQSANNAQEAATKRMQMGMNERTQLWEDTLKQSLAANQARAAVGLQGAVSAVPTDPNAWLAGVTSAAAKLKSTVAVPPKAVEDAAMALAQAADSLPNTQSARELNRLASRLYVNNRPLEDPAQLNAILKEAATKLKSPDLATKGVDAGAAKFLGGKIQETRETLGAAFEPLRDANAAYSQFTTDKLNPLRQGPVGQMAGRRGYLGDAQAPAQTIEGIFNSGVDPTINAAASPIRVAAKELGKSDPAAFQDAFKAHLSNKISEIMPAPLSGSAQAVDGGVIKQLYKGLFGDEKRFQGYTDAVAEIAQQNGQSPAAAVAGLKSLGVMLKSAANRPAGNITGLGHEDLRQLSSTNSAANLARVFGFLPFERIARGMEEVSMGKTLRTFDDLLTSPDGAATLAKLGRTPVMSPAWMATLQGFTSGGQHFGQGQQNLQRRDNPAGVTQP